MKTINDHKYSQRAVAPIIATLLMVAISVVGGILIFVFAQGFFTDTNIQSPNIESLEIFGYDARDQADLKTHIFDPTATSPAEADGLATLNAATTSTTIGLRDGDVITLFVRNKGAGAVTIDTIKVFGITYTWDSTVTASTTVPADQKFSIAPAGLPLSTGGLAAAPVIEPGQDATIIIAYEGTTNGVVKIGRPIPVVFYTGNGAAFTKQVQNGVTVG